ncbi:hypothetical protein [Phocaeicola vulgatus]|uniref:hypothetical protein n=1 Tax=Phocaeicola vulgatus TaxID=821 RepID=UPI0034A518F3
MTYGQIISILFVALLCYYAFLIVMDIQRAKAAEAAEQDNHVEEDIDISDEAQSFRPHKVSREEPKKEEEKKEDSPSENASESSQQDDASPTQSDADTSQEGKEEAEDEQEESDNSEDVYNEVESGIATPSQATESDNEQEADESVNQEAEPSDEKSSEESTDDNSDEEQPEDDDQPYRSPTYREAILTDGILVDDIFKAIDQLAETGECDLGTIIYHCESMRYAG